MPRLSQPDTTLVLAALELLYRHPSAQNDRLQIQRIRHRLAARLAQSKSEPRNDQACGVPKQ